MPKQETKGGHRDWRAELTRVELCRGKVVCVSAVSDCVRVSDPCLYVGHVSDLKHISDLCPTRADMRTSSEIDVFMTWSENGRVRAQKCQNSPLAT